MVCFLGHWAMNLGCVRMVSQARQPSAILGVVGDLKEHLFCSYHTVDAETEVQISEVTCPVSHSLKIFSSGKIYSAGLPRRHSKMLSYL